MKKMYLVVSREDDSIISWDYNKSNIISDMKDWDDEDQYKIISVSEIDGWTNLIRNHMEKLTSVPINIRRSVKKRINR